jgi:hypothetical protein
MAGNEPPMRFLQLFWIIEYFQVECKQALEGRRLKIPRKMGNEIQFP